MTAIGLSKRCIIRACKLESVDSHAAFIPRVPYEYATMASIHLPHTSRSKRAFAWTVVKARADSCNTGQFPDVFHVGIAKSGVLGRSPAPTACGRLKLVLSPPRKGESLLRRGRSRILQFNTKAAK